MKTIIKLILIYYALQILASLAVTPFVMIYQYCTIGTFESEAAQAIIAGPSFALCFVFIMFYLWKKGYLGDLRLFLLPLPAKWLVGGLLAGASLVLLEIYLSEWLGDFIPNWAENSLSNLQMNWLGLLALVVLGPVVEEVFYRGVVTRLLLRRYRPWTAILVSGLIFAIIHLNPAQFIPAFTSGMFYAWLYYRMRSLWPGILLHVLNNGFAAFMMRAFPETEDETLMQMMGQAGYVSALVAAAAVFVVFLWALNRWLPVGVPMVKKEETVADEA